MTKIRLTKEFSFEAAHLLEGYDGACREIHGHSYRLFVTVRGMRRTPAGEAFAEALGTRFERIVCVDYQPTCENMLADFAARIAPRLPEGVELYALRLHETATSYAEWVADDNN